MCDPDTLLSLSEDILKDGVAECVKYGFIRDEKILDLLLDGVMKNIEEIITRCIAIKKQVVERDEHDHGERMILNFGHTLAHAIERYYHYQTYTHGKAGCHRHGVYYPRGGKTGGHPKSDL